MTVVAEVTIPAEDFELGRILEPDAGIEVRLERIVPTGGALLPYLWIPVNAADGFERRLADNEFVEDVEVVDVAGEEALVRLAWSNDVGGLVGRLQDSPAVLLEATGGDEDWQFQIRFPDNDELSAFYREVVEEGIEVRIDRIRDGDAATSRRPYGLTAKQEELLLAAVRSGYFDVPRRTSLVELGERLGISDSAASQRLRRGVNRVLSATLVAGREVEPADDDGESRDRD